jgi:hypothetical protein
MSAGWKTWDTQNNSQVIDLSKEKNWTTIKHTTRRIQSWGRNRAFIGLTSWPEEEEEEEEVFCLYTDYKKQNALSYAFAQHNRFYIKNGDMMEKPVTVWFKT